jgi:hypothetical protein
MPIRCLGRSYGGFRHHEQIPRGGLTSYQSHWVNDFTQIAMRIRDRDLVGHAAIRTDPEKTGVTDKPRHGPTDISTIGHYNTCRSRSF